MKLGISISAVALLMVGTAIQANAAQKCVLAGGEANPAAPAAGRRAVMASRQNFIFSFSMLYGMVFASHEVYTDPDGIALSSGKVGAFWAIIIDILPEALV